MRHRVMRDHTKSYLQLSTVFIAIFMIIFNSSLVFYFSGLKFSTIFDRYVRANRNVLQYPSDIKKSYKSYIPASSQARVMDGLNESQIVESHTEKLNALLFVHNLQHANNVDSNDSTVFDFRANILKEIRILQERISLVYESEAFISTTNLHSRAMEINANNTAILPIFNPSLIKLSFNEKVKIDPSGKYKPEYLICFRYSMSGEEVYNTVDLIGFYILSAKFEIIALTNPPVFLTQLSYDGTVKLINGEDPRLFRMYDELYVIFNFIDPELSKQRTMQISKLQFGFSVSVSKPTFNRGGTEYYIRTNGPIISLLTSTNSSKLKPEKNWVPTVFNSRLFNHDDIVFVTNYDPLRMMKFTIWSVPEISEMYTPTAIQLYGTELDAKSSKLQWMFGTIRGGSPMIALNDTHSIAAFHSSLQLQLPNIAKRTYFMGLIVFYTAEFPYYITGLSKRPIVGKGMYEGAWTTVGMDYVVYPGSIEIEGDELVIAYGRNDFEGWIGRFDLNKLMTDVESVQY